LIFNASPREFFLRGSYRYFSRNEFQNTNKCPRRINEISEIKKAERLFHSAFSRVLPQSRLAYLTAVVVALCLGSYGVAI